MSTTPVLHHQARGVHPAAIVQDTAPDPVALGLQDRVLWVDTSTGPPFQLKCWNAGLSTWQLIGSGSTLATDCLSFPLGATLCNDTAGTVHLTTPDSAFAFDSTGMTLPGGHRVEQAP